MRLPMPRSERGVALLIVLLVTALLLALIFEFSYATRISLNSAINFRDSQRAYYVARSGVNFAGKVLAENLKSGKLQANLERREVECAEPLPLVSAGDTVVRVCWEDEAGKISIANVGIGQPSLVRLERLFGEKGISLDVLDRIKEKRAIRLIGELHQVMSDEEFGKVRDFISVYAQDKVDINTASSPVLQSLGISASNASMIIEARGRDLFIDKSRLASTYGLDTTTLGMLDVTSNTFFVQSFATVGEYTKVAEAVITRNTGGFTIQYWKIL